MNAPVVWGITWSCRWLEDDRVAMMLGLVPDKRTPEDRLLDAIQTRGKSLRYHYDDEPL